MRQDRPRAEGGADERDADRRGERLGIERVEAADRIDDAGIVDEHARLPEGADGLGQEPVDGSRIAAVTGDGHTLRTARGDRLGVGEPSRRYRDLGSRC